jgi:hypothetical protein
MTEKPKYLAKPIPTLTSDEIARFWKGVDRSAPNGCWPWISAVEANTYGLFSTGEGFRTATRVSYFIEHGVDPGECVMRHSCDWPPCVRPSHLIPGTYLENSKDAIDRGRRRAPARVALTDRFVIRVSEEDKSLFETVSRYMGIPVSAFVRKTLREAVIASGVEVRDVD